MGRYTNDLGVVMDSVEIALLNQRAEIITRLWRLSIRLEEKGSEDQSKGVHKAIHAVAGFKVED
jgi:hypothetical protein